MKKGFSYRVTGKVVNGEICIVYFSKQSHKYFALSIIGKGLIASWR